MLLKKITFLVGLGKIFGRSVKNFGRPGQFLEVWKKIRNVREKNSEKMYGKKSRGSKILATTGRGDFVKFYLAPSPKMRVARKCPPKFRDLAPPLFVNNSLYDLKQSCFQITFEKKYYKLKELRAKFLQIRTILYQRIPTSIKPVFIFKYLHELLMILIILHYSPITTITSDTRHFTENVRWPIDLCWRTGCCTGICERNQSTITLSGRSDWCRSKFLVLFSAYFVAEYFIH